MKTTTFKEEYCQQLIDHMKTGMSYESFGSDIMVGRSTMYDWEKVHPTWKEAKEIAFDQALKFFEQRLIAKISGQKLPGISIKDIDTSCLIFGLKTRFHKNYSEKTETEVTGSISINIDSDDAAV